ncbi:MAG: hypothetical protein ABL959_02945 [Pyrinomonadaceae bacterium]
MEIIRKAKPNREMADVKLWHCTGCGVVHMGVKGMVLNFSREDFAAFAEAVVDINYFGGWHVPGSVIDLIDHDAESYVNAVVH